MNNFVKLLIISIIAIFAAGCTSHSEIKVCSFNIRVSSDDSFDGEYSWLYRKDAVVKFINEEKPDLIGLQEALKRQGDYLESQLTDYTKFCVSRTDGVENGNSESCAVFYLTERFELVEEDAFWLSETPEKPSKGWDGAYYRLVTWVHLKDKITKRDVFLFNTHFDHIGETARMESGKLITRKINELTANIKAPAIFVTGDFNGTIDNPCMQPLLDNFGYARLDTETVDEQTGTFNFWGESASIIDHIFFKGVEGKEYKVVKSDYGVPYISDHYPVIFKAEL